MELIRKSVGELEWGMYVARLDRPWLDSPFLFQGFILEKEEDLQTLQSLCRFVEIDPERSYQAANKDPGSISAAPDPSPDTDISPQKLQQAL